MPTSFDPRPTTSGRREPADDGDQSVASCRPLAPAESEPSFPLRPGVLCLQQWLDLNA